MSNEKTNSSKMKTLNNKMKTLNKWLNKLFGLNLIKSADLDSLFNEIEFLCDKVDSPFVGEDCSCLVLLKQLDAEYMVYLVKNFYAIPFAKFPFTPNDADSRKYAKVCAEDLADALRDADEYEPIK